MSRYTGPSWKQSRRLGFSLTGTGKELARRNYVPGQHGPNNRSKLSEYGLQLAEKQKLRFSYGLSEKANVYFSKEISPEKVLEMYQLLGKKLDGKGKLEMDNGTVFLPNDLYPLEKETFRLYYTSASTSRFSALAAPATSA